MLGHTFQVRAYVALGSLSPSDVVVEATHGRVDSSDRIVAPITTPLAAIESYDGNRWRYEADVPLTRTGAFGYTVRIRPSSEFLASSAELGLQSVPFDARHDDDDNPAESLLR
jgi:starch phosphorylase